MNINLIKHFISLLCFVFELFSLLLDSVKFLFAKEELSDILFSELLLLSCLLEDIKDDSIL